MLRLCYTESSIQKEESQGTQKGAGKYLKNWIIKNSKKIVTWLVVTWILLAVFVGPLIINWLFKQPAPVNLLAVDWESDVALSYYGTIVASAIAVYGVFLTIRYSQENYKEDVRNRTLPFITIDMLKTMVLEYK